jgi:hypothetical protein
LHPSSVSRNTGTRHIGWTTGLERDIRRMKPYVIWPSALAAVT